MIKRRRGGPSGGIKSDDVEGRPCSAQGDIRLLFEQWKQQIVDEKLAASRRRLQSTGSPVHPSLLDELNVVTRIGRLRLLRKLGPRK